MSKRFTIILLLPLAVMFISLYASAQKAPNFKDYPLTQLILKDNSRWCGYYDASNNLLYDCYGYISLNKPADVHRKFLDSICCTKASDLDGDGVNDEEDKCPHQPGLTDNFGCPYAGTIDIFPKDTIVRYIFFARGTSKLSPASVDSLNSLVLRLKDNPAFKVLVYGYTDSLYKQGSNINLAMARATAAASYLISRGIEESRVRWEGFGSGNPIATNKTEAGRAKNRRVEIRLRNY